MRACRSAYVFNPTYLKYDLGPEHPLRPLRLVALNDLLDALRWLHGVRVTRVLPNPATDAELELAHSPAYIEAVKRLSVAGAETGTAGAWGLGPGDTPAFPELHQVAAAIAGGTLAAVRAVMGGETEHAFNPGGGLHHAQRERASGFCVYNDLVVAIAAATIAHGARVLYLDFDVHHGDGVQAAFYDDPRVLTVSFHETGRYLFPGTGAVPELGAGAGIGYSINVPLAAFTEDASWLDAIHSLLPALAEQFKPDLIVSQHGCDGHVWDGQSHLLLTNHAYREAARLVHELAHRYCEGRWVATGGGGYDPVRVVPRAWATVWGEMNRRTPPSRLPKAWLARWQPRAAGDLPDTLTDPPGIVPTVPRRAAIEEENRATVRRVRELALSAHVRRAYRPAGAWTARALQASLPGRDARWEIEGRPLFIQARAPLSLIRRLRLAPDMHAFTRDTKREATLLRRIAADPSNNLVIAHTPEGEIVAEVTLARSEGRWQDLDAVFEVSIEVARSWRGHGLGERLLSFVTVAPYVEDLILIALGLSWHWDLAGLNLTPDAYRSLLVRAFAPAGFRPLTTDDPEIAAAEGNVLLARTGANVPHDVIEEFERRLMKRQSWFGL